MRSRVFLSVALLLLVVLADARVVERRVRARSHAEYAQTSAPLDLSTLVRDVMSTEVETAVPPAPTHGRVNPLLPNAKPADQGVNAPDAFDGDAAAEEEAAAQEEEEEEEEAPEQAAQEEVEEEHESAEEEAADAQAVEEEAEAQAAEAGEMPTEEEAAAPVEGEVAAEGEVAPEGEAAGDKVKPIVEPYHPSEGVVETEAAEQAQAEEDKENAATGEAAPQETAVAGAKEGAAAEAEAEGEAEGEGKCKFAHDAGEKTAEDTKQAEADMHKQHHLDNAYAVEETVEVLADGTEVVVAEKPLTKAEADAAQHKQACGCTATAKCAAHAVVPVVPVTPVVHVPAVAVPAVPVPGAAPVKFPVFDKMGAVDTKAHAFQPFTDADAPMNAPPIGGPSQPVYAAAEPMFPQQKPMPALPRAVNPAAFAGEKAGVQPRAPAAKAPPMPTEPKFSVQGGFEGPGAWNPVFGANQQPKRTPQMMQPPVTEGAPAANAGGAPPVPPPLGSPELLADRADTAQTTAQAAAQQQPQQQQQQPEQHKGAEHAEFAFAAPVARSSPSAATPPAAGNVQVPPFAIPDVGNVKVPLPASMRGPSFAGMPTPQAISGGLAHARQEFRAAQPQQFVAKPPAGLAGGATTVTMPRAPAVPAVPGMPPMGGPAAPLQSFGSGDHPLELPRDHEVVTRSAAVGVPPAVQDVSIAQAEAAQLSEAAKAKAEEEKENDIVAYAFPEKMPEGVDLLADDAQEEEHKAATPAAPTAGSAGLLFDEGAAGSGARAAPLPGAGMPDLGELNLKDMGAKAEGKAGAGELDPSDFLGGDDVDQSHLDLALDGK